MFERQYTVLYSGNVNARETYFFHFRGELKFNCKNKK